MGEPVLRVVVLGNSTGYFIRPPRQHAGEGTYAEVLERELLDRMGPTEVRNSSSWTAQVSDGLKGLEPLVMHHQPRVVIVNLGMFECQTVSIPTAVFRWLFTGTPRGGLNVVVRDRVGRQLIKTYKWLTPLVLDRLPLPKRIRPRRFEDELRSIVDNIRKERAADVFLLTIPPPSGRIGEVLRDIEASVAQYNEIISRIAHTSGAGVHLVDLGPLILPAPDRLLPDGIHFSVEGHRVVGEHLADRIEKALADPGAP